MLISVKKEVEETIEIKTPCWLTNGYGIYVHITDDGSLIKVSKGFVILLESGNPLTEREIREAITYHSCTESQFKEVLDAQLYKVEEIYTKA